MDKKKQAALDYHANGRPGKIEVTPTKPCITSRDLSLAYSPGVAEPCLEIAENPEAVYKYTAKGNLVGVVSNGSAVLGLGNIGPADNWGHLPPILKILSSLLMLLGRLEIFTIMVLFSRVFWKY